MLTSFVLTIPLKASWDYRRLLILFHGVAIASLMQSMLPIAIAMVVALLLLSYGYMLFQQGRPQVNWMQLVHQAGQWFLVDTSSQWHVYTSAVIQYDVGLWLQLVLTREQGSTRLILFRDQLTDKQYRQLRILQSTSRSRSSL